MHAAPLHSSPPPLPPPAGNRMAHVPLVALYAPLQPPHHNIHIPSPLVRSLRCAHAGFRSPPRQQAAQPARFHRRDQGISRHVKTGGGKRLGRSVMAVCFMGHVGILILAMGLGESDNGVCWLQEQFFIKMRALSARVPVRERGARSRSQRGFQLTLLPHKATRAVHLRQILCDACIRSSFKSRR